MAFRIVGNVVFRMRCRFLGYEHEQAYLLVKGNPIRRPIPDVQNFPWTEKSAAAPQKPIEALVAVDRGVYAI